MSSNEEEFVEVWENSLEHEFSRLRKALHDYPCVAMVRYDTAVTVISNASCRTQSFLG